MKYLLTIETAGDFTSAQSSEVVSRLSCFGPAQALSVIEGKHAFTFEVDGFGFPPESVLDRIYPILTAPGSVGVRPVIEDPEAKPVLGTPPAPPAELTEQPWWIDYSNEYDELRPEITKMITEWQDEKGNPGELADWFVAMLVQGVGRARNDAEKAIAAKSSS